ncbi:MAG: LPS export ABC transporter periplasmic protein LptC [Pseudomonadota bacterium]|nr:LPS export ABC transporter periplasmic protein LptC [Pseudomonadota bacterium]MDE3038789.1 LPS export ABC transporter periplasmic protein LptC [Pseudomonadota bacterium]
MAEAAHYTRFVALSKHFLWILVTVIVVLLVWITEDNSGDNGARLVFSSIPKSGNLKNIMVKPHYQGVDANNRPYTVLAEKATQLDAQTVAMAAARADMTLASGAWVALNAGTATLNLQSKQLVLRDGVDVFYDGGYEFRTDHAHVDIQQGTAYGDAPVEGQGPPGTLKADGFSVTGRGQIIHFNGSVKVTLYR